MTGNDIFDPCFASPYNPGQVACGYPSLTSVTIIKLTRALPQAATVPSEKQPNPWLIVLANGQRCRVNTGAGIEVGGMTQTFACRNGTSPFGSVGGHWDLPAGGHETLPEGGHADHGM
jgi:hypothetical protein